MHCQNFQLEREQMFNDIFKECWPGIKEFLNENPKDVYWWLLGRNIDGLTKEEMESVWCIAGHTINSEYKQASTKIV